jgi:hypothetical protein
MEALKRLTVETFQTYRIIVVENARLEMRQKGGG